MARQDHPQQLELPVIPPQNPLTFEVGGKRFRAELQTPEEVGGDSCEGCRFRAGDNCTMPVGQPEEIDYACTNDTRLVWREMQ